MKSAARGRRTSRVEVTTVTPKGFSLLVGRREFFLAFRDFPWFRDASIAQLMAVTLPSSHHLNWPELDIDLAVESLEQPERYPLLSRAQPNKRLKLPGTRK
jgi:hypothetical protein